MNIFALLSGLLKAIRSLVLMGVGALACSPACAAEPACRSGNARVAFIGDSITGQGGGWLGAGYVFKIHEALSAIYPDGEPDLVPLGGSGMGVGGAGTGTWSQRTGMAPVKGL